ncbi:glycosyltransferase family 4 protein [Danxiaibacter flavus]|uniref:Glycosyltransferase family 4 protein n=1 Tax=Danxiaibacter flavus TaxID=3049108 RepID=A0ABV3ZHF3_9BACT|nr:glycosyltransferase family 4 protein [Chitinophagaceae bacterium DXS]
MDKQLYISCVSSGFGGLEINTLKLAEWLTEYGWQVHLLLLGDSKMHEAAGKFSKNITTVPKGFFMKWRKVTYMRRWINANDQSPIIFTALNKDIATASLYKRLYKSNAIVIYQQQMKVGVKKKSPVHMLRYQMVDAWISPLPYLIEETLEKTTITRDKIKLIPLSIDAKPFLENPETKSSARQNLHLPQNVKLIGVLGRIDPEKGQDFLIRCIKVLEEKYQSDYHLAIMGNITPEHGEEYMNGLHSLAESLQIKDRVHFLPFSWDVKQFYRAIDVFAMASRGEHFGMVTVEAMASGCPVVGTNKDGTKELLEDGRLGYLFEYNNESDFCEQLQQLESNEDLNSMLENAKKAVVEKYSKERMCEGMDELFVHLVEKRNK